MILISHRGNINGKKPELENGQSYCQAAIDAGYNVEIDVWYIDNKWYLGHDEPTYQIELDYLKNNNLWCHAKNIDALNQMTQYSNIHSFWHQEDDVTLTSKNFLWTYPNKKLTKNSICVLPELANQTPTDVFGICSDYIIKYKGLK